MAEGGSAQDGNAARENPIADIRRDDGRIVVSLAGELDLYNAHEVRDALLQCCAESPERLVVDLSGVTFLDSSGLRALLSARKRLETASGRLSVRNPASCAERVLAVSGLADELLQR